MIFRAQSSIDDAICVGARLQGSVWLDQDLVGPREALALGERKDFELAQVEWLSRSQSTNLAIRADRPVTPRSAAQQVINE